MLIQKQELLKVICINNINRFKFPKNYLNELTQVKKKKKTGVA